jgi:hemerythrin-like domain-containing protein
MVASIGGIKLAALQGTETNNMEATQLTMQMAPCGGSLPDLEIPMINTMVACLGSEHRRLNELTMQLAFAATRLAADSDAVAAWQRATELWDEIRQTLWPHLQIEEELVFSWGEAHHAISGPVLDTLRAERQEMHNLVAALSTSGAKAEPQDFADRRAFAQTLLGLARTLDSHVERYDGEVLPSIRRALFRK